MSSALMDVWVMAEEGAPGACDKVESQAWVDRAEERRVAAVEATGLLDTLPDREFDQLAELAGEICGTPVSVISLIDRKRQYFKAVLGLAGREICREASLCELTIKGRGLLVIDDTLADERVRENPSVTGELGIRFYAGYPLRNPSGDVLGTMVVADFVPKTLSEAQKRALCVLSEQARTRLELLLERRKLVELLGERKRMIGELKASEERFRKFMNHAPFASFIKDAAGRFVFYNRQMSERFGISMQDWLGKDDFALWPVKDAEKFRRHDVEVLRSGRMLEIAEETTEPDGRVTHWKSYKFPLRTERGETWLGGFAVDMTGESEQRKQLEEANSQLERLATTDALTGLANRRVLDERVDYEFRYALRHGTPLAIAMIDLDNFKRQNDTYGHAAGDRILEVLGGLVRRTLRVTDLGARYGGEELVVVLPDSTTDGALVFAERLLQAMRETEWPTGTVTASVGIAELTPATRSGKRLLELADDAMYEAKRGGKNQVMAHKELLRQAMGGLAPGVRVRDGEAA